MYVTHKSVYILWFIFMISFERSYAIYTQQTHYIGLYRMLGQCCTLVNWKRCLSNVSDTLWRGQHFCNI